MGDSRKLGITIESAQYAKNLPVRQITHVLDQLQTTLFHIGDSLAGGDFRVRGHPLDFIRNRCELVFHDVAIGSFQADLMLHDQQTTITGQPTLGEESLLQFSRVLTEIEEATDATKIKELIPDSRHRSRIISDIYRWWPSIEEGYKVRIRAPSAKTITLDPEKRVFLEKMLASENLAKVTEVKGVITHFNLPSDIIRITGPDGNIKLPVDSLETIKKYLGKPIVVTGDAKFDASGYVMELSRISDISFLKEISINRVFSGKDELRLIQPLTIALDWREKNWIMKNEELGITAHAKDYDDALKEFEQEFFFVWREYGLADDDTLTSGAQDLKRRINLFVGDRPHF